MDELLFAFLDLNCVKTDKRVYTFHYDAYKKGKYNNSIEGFIEACKPFYVKNKLKYLERELTYNRFTTILRQICNQYEIPYTTQIKYDQSRYNIVYYITRLAPHHTDS
jgi:hypothetical protein